MFFLNLFKHKKKKSDSELFFDFLKKQKDKLNSETEKAMLNYLEEIYKKAISLEKKEEKKKTKVSTWITQDLEIDNQRKREKEAEENKLPHPTNE